MHRRVSSGVTLPNKRRGGIVRTISPFGAAKTDRSVRQPLKSASEAVANGTLPNKKRATLAEREAEIGGAAATEKWSKSQNRRPE